MTRDEWFRLVIAAIMWLLTLVMAGAGIILAFLHFNLPAVQRSSSTLKIGKSFEFSSDVVGLGVMALALLFFGLAGRWFLYGTGAIGQDLRDYLVKTPGENISRSELVKFLRKE